MTNSLFAVLKKLKPFWFTLRPTCLLCLTTIKNSTLAICDDCRKDLPVIIQGCQHCGLPIPHQGICGQCLQQPPSYHKIIAPYRYDFPIAQLITKFKYQQQWPMGHLLASLLTGHLQQNYNNNLAKPQYLIPVPQAKQRLRQRGFNQAEMLAKWLGKNLVIPIHYHLLTRVIDTPPQQQLSAKKRLHNLKNVFNINPSINIQGLHLAIVDDVVTTGATANTLAKILYKAGATRVDIYTIARTPQTFK